MGEMKEHMDDVMAEMTEQEEERQKIAVRAQKEHDDQLARQAAISKGGIRQSSRVQDSAVEQAEKAREEEALRKELAFARLQAIRDEVGALYEAENAGGLLLTP